MGYLLGGLLKEAVIERVDNNDRNSQWKINLVDAVLQVQGGSLLFAQIMLLTPGHKSS
jgi:hypothetical protein